MTMIKKPEKLLKVGVCTPTAGTIQAAYCMSLLKMCLHFLQTPVLAQEYTNKQIITQMQVGANIGANRDSMVDKCLAEECTHILFIDDDMGFASECLNILIARQLPMVLANYRRKIPPGYFTAVEKRDDISGTEIITKADSTSLVPCQMGGFGFCLIEAAVLRAVKRPRFLMEYIPEANLYTTEDYPFFNAVHKAGFPIFVDQEVSKRVWHNGNFNYGFDQVLDPRWATPYHERNQI